MGDINIAVIAKNQASAALTQVNADLTALGKTGAQTGASLESIGRTQLNLGTASASIQAVINELKTATTEAQLYNRTLSEPVRVQNAGGVEAVSAGIRGARAELDALLKQYQELAKAGKLDYGEGTSANLAKAEAAIGKQIALLKEVEKASQAAGKAGVLGDGSGASKQIAEVSRTATLLTQGLKGVESQAQRTGKAIDGVGKGGNLGGLKSQVSEIDGAFGKLGNIFSGGLGGAAGIVGLGATAFAISQIASSINDAVLAADRLDKLRGSFDQLASSAGQSGDEMLDAMRSASSGMISDANLIQSANKAMLLGVADTGQELTALLDVARVRGQAMGLSVTDAFNDIVTGLGRESALILDNLGITLDLDRTYREYAATLGKTVGQLDAVERKQALVNKVMEDSKNISAPPPTGAGAAIAQSQAAGANAQVAAGKAFAPITRDAFQAWLDGLMLVQGQYDEVAVAVREVNDLVADGQGVTQFGVPVELDETQVAAFQDLAVAWQKLTAAQTAGVEGVEKYEAGLLTLTKEAEKNVHITQEQQAQVHATVTNIQLAVTAHEAHAQALAKAADAASRASPYYSQMTEQSERMAVSAFRSSAEMVKLAEGMGEVGRVALSASSNIDEFNAAIERSKAGFALADRAQAIKQAAINQANAAAQRVVDDGGDPNQVAADLTRINDQIFNMAAPVENTTAAWFLWEQQVEGANTELVATADGLEEANATAKRLAQEGLQAVQEQFDSIKGKVASVIADAQALPTFKAGDLFSADELTAKGLTFDAQIDIGMAANGGIRPDAINENARRLMAIAKEGLADQSWLEEFKREVPAVFAELEGNPDIRGSALRILQEFENGMRPELMDRGGIKDRVKQMILGEQNAAALAEEIAREIATEMGISLQQAMSATSTALGIGTGEGAGGSNVAAPDMTPQGTLAGESLRAGMIAGFNADGMTGVIVAKIDAEFSNPKSIDAIKKSGGTVGAWWGKGFVAGAGDNVAPGVYEFFAAGLLPFVVAALQGQSSRTEANP
jgi:hypothetical protein